MSEQIWNAIGFVLAGTITALSPFAIALAVQGARYLAAKLRITLSEEQVQQIRFAAETGVARASDVLRNSTNAGAAKKAIAVKTAASLAPKAFGSLPADQQLAIVEGTYAKLRPSLQTPSLAPPGGSLFPAGTVLQVLSEAPTTAPRAAKLPAEAAAFAAAEADTHPDSPQAKREAT